MQFIKKNISPIEKEIIIKKARLKEYYARGLPYYDNKDTKVFDGGFFVKIDAKNTLKIIGSVHKFWNWIHTKKLENYDLFTMEQARQSIVKMLDHYGIDSGGLYVHSYEVGANIPTEINPKDLLSSLESIRSKKMYYNPMYKHESVKTTDLHRDFRAVHKVYDKLHEMQDKKRETPKAHRHIIRMESLYRRIEKTELVEFIALDKLEQIKQKFMQDFEGLRFYPNIIYQGSGSVSRPKIELARLVITCGTLKALQVCKEWFEAKESTAKQYRMQKEFIKFWFSDHIKQYKAVHPNFMPFWAESKNTVYQQLN